MSKEAAAQSKKRKGGNEPVAAAAAAQKRTRISTKDAKPTAPEESDDKITSISARNAVDRKQKPGAKPKKAPAKKAAAPAADDFAGFSDSDDDDEPTPAADQTALIAGFSDSDSDSAEGASAPPLPAVPADVQAQLSSAPADPERTPGTVYVGRLPHGFHEPQLHGYLSQFGDVARLRVSRNKTTGRPKHYAFVEFASAAVADIVARTMDKYLLFGHILQVRRLPEAEVHPELWKGAGKRFKALPRAKVEGGRLARGRGREAWEKKVKGETRKRKAKAEQLKELGYEFDMPELKKVADVPRKEKVEAVEASAAAEIEAPTEVAAEELAVAAVVGETAAGEAATPEEAAAPKRKSTRQAKTITKRTRLSQ